MSEMSQAQAPTGGSESMDPTEDIVPGGAEDTGGGVEPSEADMPGAMGSGGSESASDPMPDTAGTGS